MPNVPLSLKSSIHKIFARNLCLNDSMQLLLDEHEKFYPYGDWSPFKAIEFEHELERLKSWLRSTIETEPPSNFQIAGLWFGLHHPVVEIKGQAVTVADFYVAGATRFEFDGELDWVVRPAYVPEGRDANSNVLATIYRLAYGDDVFAYDESEGLGVKAEEFLGLGYTCFVVNQLLEDCEPRLILCSNDPVGVAVGFDAGGPLYIGFVTPTGFQVRDPQEAIAALRRNYFESKAKFPDGPYRES